MRLICNLGLTPITMERTGAFVGKFELNLRPIWLWLEPKILLKTKEESL